MSRGRGRQPRIDTEPGRAAASAPAFPVPRPAEAPEPRTAPGVVGPAGAGGPAQPDPAAGTGPRLRVDWPACKAHQLCAEILPELIRLDEWGYPLVAPGPVPPYLEALAERAVASCPTLALRLTEVKRGRRR